jgi:signal transduction histidine kinase
VKARLDAGRSERDRRVSLNRTLSRTAGAGRRGGGAKLKSARTAARLAWSISALAVAFGGLFLVLLALNSRDPEASTYEYWGADAVTAIIFPVVGALIVSRQPRNALGWLFCVMGFSMGLASFASEYATYALIVESSFLPGAVMAAWLGTWVGFPGFISVPLIPLLFPDGRPPSPHWRPLVWLAAGVIVAATVSFALMPGPLEEYPSVENPLGIEGAKGANEALLFAAVPTLGFTLLAGIASLVVRYRRSQGVERQQLKWFTYAAALAPLGLVGNTLFPDLAWLIGGVSVSLIPLAIGIAILRYRLYDIDLVINRTLVYGALTACVVGLYVLVVGYLGVLFHTDDNLLISLIAAGLVAVLFAPLRDRMQRGVNRLMYGERDDPYAVISRLGERLEATLAPEAALQTIVETVAGALKLPYAAVTLKQGGEFVRAAEHGTPPEEPVVLPLTYQGEPVGQLILTLRSPGETFSSSDKRLLEDLARQAGVAVHTVRLTAELQHSREQLVTAREEERRRLRRDLHDGLGPRLAAQTLKVGSARFLYPRNPAAADGLLSDLETDMEATIAEVRRLVYGLRPPALDEFGLAGAIREAATQYESGDFRVSVKTPERLPPLPAAVEVAAYRIATEALTNVVRHAHAKDCVVRLSLEDGLVLEVIDDGVGVPVDRTPSVGLTSMRERAEEIGGECTVKGSPVGGTHVLTRLPLPDAAQGREVRP